MKALSAIVFLLGALAMTGGATWVWVSLLTTVMERYGPGFAVAGLVLSTVFFRYYWGWISAPWRAWHALWQHFDEAVDR